MHFVSGKKAIEIFSMAQPVEKVTRKGGFFA